MSPEDKKYFDFVIRIGEDAIDAVTSALCEYCYSGKIYPVPNPNELLYNTMSISFFYNTRTSTFYITYELDELRKRSVQISDREIYNRIYSALRWTAEYFHLKMVVVGEPTSRIEYSCGRSNYLTCQNGNSLNVDTRTVWSYKKGKKGTIHSYFIEDKNLLNSDMSKINMTQEQYADYCQEVIALNKSDMVINPNLRTVFDKFVPIYERYFNRTLKPTEDWKSFTIYFNIDHDYEEEARKIQYHKPMELIFRERIMQYLEEWRQSHEDY